MNTYYHDKGRPDDTPNAVSTGLAGRDGGRIVGGNFVGRACKSAQ